MPGKRVTFILCVSFLCVQFAALAGTTRLYVSPAGNDAWSGRLSAPNAAQTDGPLATPARAQALLRGLKHRTQPISVQLRGGRYELTAPLVFTPEDSGTKAAPITYEAYPGETPILSGGRRVMGLQRDDEGRWTATIPDAAHSPAPRLLSVNGGWRTRPRLPKSGWYRVAGLAGMPADEVYVKSDRFEFSPGNIKAEWANLRDIEVVVLHFWNDVHLPIAQVDAATRVVQFTKKGGKRFTADKLPDGARYYVENVKEALTVPGEWYLDRPTGVLTYLPQLGEQIATAEIVLPRLPVLISIAGNPNAKQYVEFLSFRGLTFADAGWDLPAGDANTAQASALVPGALMATGWRESAFSGCTVKNCTTYGLDLREGCQRITVEGNDFHDLGGGGIHLNGQTAKPWDVAYLLSLPEAVQATLFARLDTRELAFALGDGSAAEQAAALTRVPAARAAEVTALLAGAPPSKRDVSLARYRLYQQACALEDAGAISPGSAGRERDAETAHLQNGENRITDNHLYRLGRVFHSAIGIFVQHSHSNLVAHNHIHDLDYSGISVGWVWAYAPSISHHNIIEYNDIHDIGRGVLSDMGGIYLLGRAPGTVVRRNRVRGVDAWSYGGWGIYTDEGSSELLIEENLVYRTKSGCFNHHYGQQNLIRNNIFALSRSYIARRSVEEPYNSFTFERNILYYENTVLLEGRWTNGNFTIDRNLYYCTEGEVLFPTGPLASWQRLGHDTHSRIADPRFLDPRNGDFHLAPDSPAFKLGFKAIDLSTVGPRKIKSRAK